VISDIPVDDEAPVAPVVTSRISRFVGAKSFGGAHRVEFAYVYSYG
jgi:hypothetical protein